MRNIIHQIITVFCSFIFFLIISITCYHKKSTCKQGKPCGNENGNLVGVQNPCGTIHCCEQKPKNILCKKEETSSKKPGKMSISEKKIKSKKRQPAISKLDNKNIENAPTNQRVGYSKSTIAFQEAALSQIFNTNTNTTDSDRGNENGEKKTGKIESKKVESKDEDLLDLKDTQSPPKSE